MPTRGGVVVVIGALVAGCSAKSSSAPPLADPPAVTEPARPGAPARMIRDASAECPEPFAANAPAAGLNGGFVVAGLDRRFFLRLPITDSVEPSPLMVFFHGTNGSGDIVDRFPFAATLAERGFIVVGPYGEDLGTVWPEWDAMRADGDRERPNSDLHFFDTLVACLAGHFAIDQNRLYVSGMSAGGIMSNRVLRERSSLLAGGIVGSGIFDMTEPAAPADLDAMAVMVAFGGDNDEWGGDHAGKTLPSINFAEQASLASKFYEGQPNVTQYACRGNDVGHRWLQPANELMADFLLAHPKGLADNASYALPALPTDADVVCTADAVQHDPTLEVVCPLKTDPRCRAACQMLADCVVENTTVRPIMEPQLSDYGFYGEHREDCSDCVSQCESDAAAGGAADDQVLDCIVAAAPQCAQGIQGALPLTKTVNGCCDGRHDSAVCRRICAPVLQNNTVSGFFTGCAGF